MGGFCTGIRGEEMLLIDMFGTAASIRRPMKENAPDPHFKLIVIGRTKGAQQDGNALVTSWRKSWKAVCEETTSSQAHGV
jgi:hypothetical protein